MGAVACGTGSVLHANNVYTSPHQIGCRVWESAGGLLAIVAPRHSVGFVSTRAADFSVKSMQVPRPHRQARIKTIWGESDRVESVHGSCEAATVVSQKFLPLSRGSCLAAAKREPQPRCSLCFSTLSSLGVWAGVSAFNERGWGGWGGHGLPVPPTTTHSEQRDSSLLDGDASRAPPEGAALGHYERPSR